VSRFLIDAGCPGLLAFQGPDAVRFLNGQLTQDVRLLQDGKHCLPACVTDAKGRLQFRVWLWKHDDGALMVQGGPEMLDALEARLTRYLIADDVEVSHADSWRLLHFTSNPGPAPDGVLTRQANRYTTQGEDWWVPAALAVDSPDGFEPLEGKALETWRIERGVPVWGKELVEGLFPAEAGLDASDVSFHKGCYIGQEVISRIEHTGKVNRRLVRLALPPGCTAHAGPLLDASGKESGQLTSIAPQDVGDFRPALGYLKRGSMEWFIDGIAATPRDTPPA
jgi:folate-binding protein YgfZ